VSDTKPRAAFAVPLGASAVVLLAATSEVPSPMVDFAIDGW
jgi:hypothetical protein